MAGIVLQIEVGLDQLQFHQQRRAAGAADQIDPGVEQGLFDRGEDGLRGGAFLGRGRMRGYDALMFGLDPEVAGLGALADRVAEGAAEIEERDFAFVEDAGMKG